MSSRRRILASRRNGRKSRGPITPAGKARSSGNSVRHGLLARVCVLETESREYFDDLTTQYFARFQPVDEVEFGLVEEMIAASWRLRRCWAHETRTLDKEIAAQPEAGPLDRLAAGIDKVAETPTLHLMHRYETRLQMMYRRALNALLLVRATSPAPEPGDDLPNEPNPENEHHRVVEIEPCPMPPPLVPPPEPASPPPGSAPSLAAQTPPVPSSSFGQPWASGPRGAAPEPIGLLPAQAPAER